MVQFVYPGLLYLLLLLPAVAALMAWARYRRRVKLSRYGNPAELSHLMPDASKYMPWVKLSVGLLAMGFLVVTLARPRLVTPQDDSETDTTTSRGIEVMICLDVSRSMLASSTDEEEGVSRLQRAKHVLEKLIDKMRDDKVGLIVFAGDAYTQLPITNDYVSAKMFLQSINPDIVPTQGTAIGAALQMAMNSFTPDDKMKRAIVVLTDGENFEDDAVQMAKQAASAGIQVDVVGLGSAKGARIPIGGGQYMPSPEGDFVVTKLDDKTAQQIAQAGDGVYVNAAQPDAVSVVDKKLDTLGKNEFQRRAFTKASEQFPAFALVAFILLCLDFMTVTRKISWLKRITFFTKKG